MWRGRKVRYSCIHQSVLGLHSAQPCCTRVGVTYDTVNAFLFPSYEFGTSGLHLHAGWRAGIHKNCCIQRIVVAAMRFEESSPGPAAHPAQIWSGFQLVGDGTGQYDFAVNGVLLASIMIGISTLINAFGVKLMTRINSIGVFVELAAAVLLILALGWHMVRGPEVLFDTAGFGDEHPLGFFGVFLIGAMASGYVMYGFDTASSLGEETKDPKRTAPKAIPRAVTASFVLGGLQYVVPLADDDTEPCFCMGKWGMPVNILAVLWGGAMTLNLVWPRPEIYNSVPPFEWYLQWGGVLFVGAVVVIGVLLYRLKIRHQTGVLAEHAAPAADATVAGEPVTRDGDLEPAR
ncbi:amino acid permease [Arthrobacter sp. ISL-69]|uniref:amino acid permease n=1 Tax=Arthrobacter sp. ISL-69 TaxID=2819113 RepID=UPI0028893362|nr:amino acid permease [Arthrobacter sp. ISL-69]